MAAPVTALQPAKQAPGPSPLTPEQRYWKSFRSQQLIPSPHSSPITHISHPPLGTGVHSATAPEIFAVTSGSRIQIFSSRNRKVTKTISRFGLDDVAHSGEIRRDGRVIVAGGDSGAVQVFDINSRAILKTWKEHKQPVWTTKWSPTEMTTLMTASDDRTVRLWDLPSSESVTTFTGHQDYVRSGCFMHGQNNSSLLVSGSYDQTVRLWDTRTSERAVMIFKHAAPVESVLPLPSGTTLLASADNQISVLDLVAAKPQEVLKSHQKTVTALSLASNGTRVISGSLDGHIKVFETDAWNVVAGSKYSSPILALSVIPSITSAGSGQLEDRHIAVGLQTGVLSIKTRFTAQQKSLQREREKEMQALLAGELSSYDAEQKRKRAREGAMTQGKRKRLRGLYDESVLSAAELVVEGNERSRSSKKKPPAWDTALRNAQYSRALDLVLSPAQSKKKGRTKNNTKTPISADPRTVHTVLHALHTRSALRAALRGRDEESLAPVIKFLTRHLADAQHIVLTSRVAMLVLEMYAGELETIKNDGPRAGGGEFENLVRRLHSRVRTLVSTAQNAECTKGMLELVLAENSQHSMSAVAG